MEKPVPVTLHAQTQDEPGCTDEGQVLCSADIPQTPTHKLMQGLHRDRSSSPGGHWVRALFWDHNGDMCADRSPPCLCWAEKDGALR